VKEAPIKRSGLSDAVIEVILDLIKNGDLKPGTRLPSIDELAEKFHVGRSSIREALKKLQVAGVVEIKHGKGTFIRGKIDVNSLSEPIGYLLASCKLDILHIMEARKIIEKGTVALAAERASEKEIEKLEEIVEEMRQLKDDPENFARANVSFHVAVAEASKNPILPVFFNSIYDLFLKQQEVVAKILNLASKSIEYHTKICEAIKEHNPQRAVKEMREHLNYIEKSIIEGL